MSRISTLVFVVLGLAVAVGLATAASPWASPDPDGLERVAEDKGFLDTATSNRIQDDSPIPDYAFPGIGNERVATGVAGFVGTIGLFAVGLGLALLLLRHARGPTPETSTGG